MAQSSARRRFVGAMFGLPLLALPFSRTAQAIGFCTGGQATGRTCEARILSALAGQSAQPQYQSQWCWAAAIAMIFDYFGSPVSQARIVKETFGSIVNLPAYPEDLLRPINRAWADDSGRRFVSLGGLLPFNTRTIATFLGNDRPLIIGSVGHIMVLTAYRWVEDPRGETHAISALALDPALGGRERLLSPTEIRQTSLLAFVQVT